MNIRNQRDAAIREYVSSLDEKSLAELILVAGVGASVEANIESRDFKRQQRLDELRGTLRTLLKEGYVR